MKNIYIFDLDGTLVSSVNEIKNTVSGYLAKRGITLTEEVWSILIAIGYEKTAIYFKEHYNDPLSVEEIVNELQQSLIVKYASTIMLKPHAKEYLQKLYDGGAEMYILSASPLIFINPCLKNNGVDKFFKKVISIEDYAPYTKLDGELYDLVAKDLNFSLNDVIYFEDSIAPITTAIKKGINLYAVKDAQAPSDFEKIKLMATKTIYDFGELL